ncbi:MAG: sugar ABC transporter permease, partial [Rhodobacterales bacterium]
MTNAPQTHSPQVQTEGGFARFLRATEIDPRLLGMVGALLLIWVAFEVYSAFVLGRPSLLLGAS